MKTNIWVEKYRPKSVNEIIFQDDKQKKLFTTFVESGDFPHLFLAGVQGTGKTTTSMALVRDIGIDKSDVLKINCSDEKIDAIRSKVVTFANTMAMGKFKVVRLEEIDYLSLDAQALLRSLIEETQQNCRFIATCNYSNKVIPPLKSRFQEVYFKQPDKEKVALFLVDILERENIEYDPETLLTFIDVAYPDIRKTIQLVQGNCGDGKLSSPTVENSSDWRFTLLSLISSGDFKQARKLVCESSSKEEHEDVYRFLYENVSKLKVKDVEEAILTIAEYLKSHTLVADTEINLAACFIALSRC